MSICQGSAKIARKIVRNIEVPVVDLPAFLCPGILKFARQPASQLSRCTVRQRQHPSRTSQRRLIHTTVSNVAEKIRPNLKVGLEKLPQQCPGCGALSQLIEKDDPGFYTLTRRGVKEYLGALSAHEISQEDVIVKAAVENAGSAAESLNLGNLSTPSRSLEPPTCDRCHALKHHDTGLSIQHPSIQSIQDTIFESPYKYNHVYHILDAADFPMSLVPGLQKLLHITPQRSLNRRSKTGRFYHGRKTEVSFIITRSDLLAPQKEQVDSMMPYLRATLRDALGRSAKDVRLGNVSCVSAKRQWWTKYLKEEIWKRGGGGWMVGKVNVGKSQLFHDVFPKGRRDRDKILGKGVPKESAAILEEIKNPWKDQDNVPAVENTDETLENQETAASETLESPSSMDSEPTDYEFTATDSLDTFSLLPPAPPETDYPAMPLVSSLPGTTASPIRLSFGNGKGELIDLPGLSRGDLELHVQPEHRSSLVMRSLVKPKQQVIKPGQSLLLGGFIRITPTDPNVIILSYAFTPIKPHLTSTGRAIGTQMETRKSTVENIALPGTAEKIKSAGAFYLKWDVTRQQTGPVTRPDGVGIKLSQLPYRVLSTDILIEGCGWVELVAQVRKRRSSLSEYQEEKNEADEEAWQFEPRDENEEIDPNWPAVEVFTPEGKFIASRRPMNAWLNVAEKPSKGKLMGRPRRAMKGTKKAAKVARRVSKPL